MGKLALQIFYVVATFVVLGLWMWGIFHAYFFVVGTVLVLALLLWCSFSSLKRRRLMEDLPTSKTTGVFIGLVELKGTAESELPFKSVLAEKSCVRYSWKIEEYYKNDKDDSGWITVASGGESAPFYLRDDHGIVRIDPDKAEIVDETVFSQTCKKKDPLYYGKGPSAGITNSTGKRFFTEKVIELHKPIYVVGQSRERQDCVAAEIAYDERSPLFLISTESEESHRTGALVGFFGYALFAVIVPFIAVAIFIPEEEITGHHSWQAILPFWLSGAVVPVWLVGWLWTTYNSLISLKNRVKMAVANIDVELKRRHDLIPQLVQTIEAYRKHEKEMQHIMALLRSQAEVTSVEGDTPETEQKTTARGCTKHLVGLMERYPDLKADESFLSLQHRFAETEQRIALARNYHNDIIETYNNRRERFPENVIAVFAGLRPIPMFVAEDFERAAINVTLV